jgi:hypothetical protein
VESLLRKNEMTTNNRLYLHGYLKPSRKINPSCLFDSKIIRSIFVQSNNMTKIIIQIERSADAKLLEAFAQKLGLMYSYQTESTDAISDDEWINAMNGSWNDFPETAEELNAQIEENRTLGRPIEML